MNVLQSDAGTDLLPEAYGMDDVALEKYAELLLWAVNLSRTRPLSKSDLVQIRYDLPALPLAEALSWKLNDSGQVPVPRAEPSPNMDHFFLKKANNKRLGLEIPGERELAQNLAGSIRIYAPTAATHLSEVDPAQVIMREKGLQGLRNIRHARQLQGELGQTSAVYPTWALARLAGMPLEVYGRQVVHACMLQYGTPLTNWKLLRGKMQSVADWLNSMDMVSLRVRSKNMDLLLQVGASRKWVCASGRNIPSYEIYLAPDCRGTEGEYYANLPSYQMGHRVDNLKLLFRMGQVRRFRAQRGETIIAETLRIDGGANKVGEFSLVDKRFTPIDRPLFHPILDENFGGENGSCHIALGQSLLHTLDRNPRELTLDAFQSLGLNVSLLHWDLVNTEEKTVMAKLADGSHVCIYENGQFTC